MIPPVEAEVVVGKSAQQDFLASYQESVRKWIGVVVSSQENLSKDIFAKVSSFSVNEPSKEMPTIDSRRAG